MRTLTLLLALSVPASAWWFGPKYASGAPPRPIAVDGDGRDWPAERRDDAGDMTFAFAHDAKDLYVMLSPHTREAKAQLAGAYDQDLYLWVDRDAGMSRRLGVRLTAPQKAGVDTVRLTLAAGPDPGCADIEIKAGPLDQRGVIEARVPLRLLGAEPPKTLTVGLEAAEPLRPPPRRTADPKDPASRELFAPVRLWVRVKLPRG